MIACKLSMRFAARLVLAYMLLSAARAAVGPFPPAAGLEGSTAVHMQDPAIVAWATGWTNYAQGADLDAAWTNVAVALGPASGDTHDVVSLGNGGELTLTFDAPIVNGPGFDFAVFGNSFNDHFLELAYVEVSSDGTNFVRFPNTYLGTNEVPFWGALMDPTLIAGLAGKYRVGFGMPFDLDELEGAPDLDVHDVRYVRLVDIIGDGRKLDSHRNPIYDPTPTWGSAGFDLEAVGVLNQWTLLHAWRVEHFGEQAYAPAAANAADWSGDGVPNLLAFGLRLDPTQWHHEPLFHLVPESDETGRWVEIEYTRRAGFTNLRAAVHADLSSGPWTHGSVAVTETVEEWDEETERVRARPAGIFTDADRLFFRLEVIEP